MNLQDKVITVREASIWLARMAAGDGVVSSNERKILREFAEKYGLDPKYLYRLAHAVSNDVEIPEVELISASKWKGQRFEEFIVSLCSDTTYFTLMSWRSDKSCGGIYPKDSLLPDLHIRHRFDSFNVDYYIECKFRTSLADGLLDLSNQLYRYREMTDADGPWRLLLALGIGGYPDNPEKLYLIPDECISDNGIININECDDYLCNQTPDSFRMQLMKFYL